jgi:transcriptional regulator with XRE-family HTH domain
MLSTLDTIWRDAREGDETMRDRASEELVVLSRETRRRHGLTQKQFARELGIATGTLACLEARQPKFSEATLTTLEATIRDYGGPVQKAGSIADQTEAYNCPAGKVIREITDKVLAHEEAMLGHEPEGVGDCTPGEIMPPSATPPQPVVKDASRSRRGSSRIPVAHITPNTWMAGPEEVSDPDLVIPPGVYRETVIDVDFGGHEDLLEAIRTTAQKEFRTVGQQLLYLTSRALAEAARAEQFLASWAPPHGGHHDR